MIVKLLTEHHLEFLSWRLRQSTLVKMSYCWKSHAGAQNFIFFLYALTVFAQNAEIELLKYM